MLHPPHSYNLFHVFPSKVVWRRGPCINKSLITFVAVFAQYIYYSCPAPSQHYAAVIILFAGYGLIKLPLMISLTRIHYDDAWRSRFNQKPLPDLSHISEGCFCLEGPGGIQLCYSLQPITCWGALVSFTLRSESCSRPCIIWRDNQDRVAQHRNSQRSRHLE